MELVKKEVLLLGRDFHLKDACSSQGSKETERKKMKAKRKGRKEAGKAREEERKASLKLLSWIGLNPSTL